MGSTKPINVEIYGWYVTIDVLEVSRRPDWEIRVNILRSKDDRRERRGHRFYVEPEVAEKLKIDKWPDKKRMNLFPRAAKRVILRDFQEIFSEPEGGLDSLRPLAHSDFAD